MECNEGSRMYHLCSSPSRTSQAPWDRPLPDKKKGEYGRRLQPNRDKRGREGEKERRLLSQCAGAETNPLVLKDIGRN